MIDRNASHGSASLDTGRALGAPFVAWWCHRTDLRDAAVRMRAAILMRMLCERGLASGWYESKNVDHYQWVVVRKRYDDDTLAQLRRFKQGGGQVVLDLCDNHFVPASKGREPLHQVENLRRLVYLADAVVTSAESLADIVRQECPGAPRVMTIGDVPDDLSIVETSPWRRLWRIWKIRRELAYLERAAPSGVTRLVWFGSSGGRRQLAGMVDLARIAGTIAKVGQTHPLHLTVFSDSAKRYRRQVAPILPTSRYIEWDPWTFDTLLCRQHVALIPAKANAYTVCKSDNRVVTALRAGLAVVADPVPSYAAYSGVIILGDIEGGLRRYSSDPEARLADASLGKAMSEQPEGAERVIAQWLAIFEPLT